jgi:hypothetical protein
VRSAALKPLAAEIVAPVGEPLADTVELIVDELARSRGAARAGFEAAGRSSA